MTTGENHFNSQTTSVLILCKVAVNFFQKCIVNGWYLIKKYDYHKQLHKLYIVQVNFNSVTRIEMKFFW